MVIGLDASRLPAGWHGALYPEDADTPLMLDRSIFLPSCAPPGKSILDLLIGRERARELIPLDDNEVKRQMLGAVRPNPPAGSALPGDDGGLFYRVYRWEETLCMGTPGMLAAVAEIPGQLAGRIDNLYSAGDYMRVPSVNGALSSGCDVGREVADILGRGVCRSGDPFLRHTGTDSHRLRTGEFCPQIHVVWRQADLSVITDEVRQ